MRNKFNYNNDLYYNITMTIYNNPNPKKTNMRFSVYNNPNNEISSHSYITRIGMLK